MRLRDLTSLSWHALMLNRRRSILTMLGIVIGIASVILMMAVGQAAQTYLLSQIASFGSDLVFVSNGKGDEQRGGPPSAGMKQTLSPKDYTSLRKQSWVRLASGAVITSDLVSRLREEKNTRVSGSTPDELIIFNMRVAKGRFLDEEDEIARRRVTVIGQDIVKKLFGEQDPIGQTMQIGKLTFRVIGVMAPSGTRFFSNIDDQVYIPYTTFFDAYHKDRLNFISVKVQHVSPTMAKDRLRLVLRDTHNLDNPKGILSKDDFRVASQEDAIKNANTIGTILQILLGSIAAISLFVAGIGIMNIMYVTVTERTKEIGLRKAIGAREQDIMGQFLMEAVMVTTTAGAMGIFLGLFLSWMAIFIISHLQDGWVFTMPWGGLGLACGVSMVIGLVFGYFPARKAARLHPIESLRYE